MRLISIEEKEVEDEPLINIYINQNGSNVKTSWYY